LETAKIKIGNSLSDDIGVTKGCIFGKALAELSDGIKINGQAINNIRYADDTVIIANNN